MTNTSYLNSHNANVSRRVLGYFGLTIVFFLLSLLTIYFVHQVFAEGQLRIDSRLLSVRIILFLSVLLILYFLADGLRLYCIIRAIGNRIAFPYIIKLVFVNIFVSNVTPLATGGGFVQIYFLKRQGMPIGEATAATSLRTILASLVLFTLTPVIVWFEPNLFRIFNQRNLLYGLAGFSCLYIVLFSIILFRIRVIKRWLFRVFFLFRRLKLISRQQLKRLFLKVSRELDAFSDGFKRYYRGNPGWTALSVIFTIFFLFMLFSFSIILIRALGYKVPILTILAFQVVVTFFMYFAPTPGAAGVAEGGYGLLFAQLVHKQDIALLTLSWRFLTIYIGVLIGIFIIYREIFSGKKGENHEP